MTRLAPAVLFGATMALVPAFGQSARYGRIAVDEHPQAVTFDTGIIRIAISQTMGLAEYAWNGAVRIHGAYSGFRLDGMMNSSGYARHTLVSPIIRISDGFGKGIRVSVLHATPGKPSLRQTYYLYEDKPYFFVEAEVENSAPVRVNWLAPLAVETEGGVDIGVEGDNRVLFVPWDNDYYIRFRSDPMNGAGTSYEASAMFDNQSRRGLVVGSVTHDTWKTGVDYRGSRNRIDSLQVYGGASSEVTRDVMPHGFVSGTRVVSPRIFIGYFDDWRTGMEEFGAANRVLAPPLPWKGDMPAGWNSWSAYRCTVNPQIMDWVSDFIRTGLMNFGRGEHGAVYVNWDSACPEKPFAWGDDYARVASHIKANGQHPGFYFSTHGSWRWNRDPDSPVPVTNGKYTWKDVYLRDDRNQIITVHGWKAVDPTHPGTKMYVEYILGNYKRWGYEFVKIDFLTHLAVEGRHYLKDMTATQAYNYAMNYIREAIGGSMFISLSIAPLFPGAEYSHARRISCDAHGSIKDTEYMLNSVTYGWWLGNYYRYNDGDHMVAGPVTADMQAPSSMAEARSRVSAGAIAGLFLDSDRLADDAEAQARAKVLLARPEILALARNGKTFRPVEGDTGEAAADTFTLQDGDNWYLAAFNYKDDPISKSVDLARAGFRQGANYSVTDLWTGARSAASGWLTLRLGGRDATILRLTTGDGDHPLPGKNL